MAGDGKAGPATRLTPTSIRRNPRFVSSRSNTRSFNIEPPPIIMEIGSTIVRVGYAEQSRPQHLIAMENPLFDDTNRDQNSNLSKSESEWYLLLAPLLEQVYDRLMCRPSSRRVVCVYKPYAPSAFQKALTQHMWNQGVPAQVHVDCLQVLPLAQGWKRGLIVHVSREEAFCVCYADGYVTPNTYQMVPTGYKQLLKETVELSSGKAIDSLPQSPLDLEAVMNETLLNEHNPNSLVVAILMCLQACPRDLRAQVVSNFIVCGDGVALLPDLSRLVAKRVEQMLDQPNIEQRTYATPPTNVALLDRDPVFTMVPIDITSLQPLAARLTLLSCAPYRADWISWVGASLWAATWNKYDEDETPIPWVIAPSKLFESS
jgi:hypothetical protein